MITAAVGEMYPQIQNQPNKDPIWIKMSVLSHKTKWNTVNSVWEDHPCPLMIHVSVQTSLLSLTNQCCCRYLLITYPSESQHRNCFLIDTWNSLMDNGKKKQTQHCHCLFRSLDWVHSNKWSWFSWYQHFFPHRSSSLWLIVSGQSDRNLSSHAPSLPSRNYHLVYEQNLQAV